MAESVEPSDTLAEQSETELYSERSGEIKTKDVRRWDWGGTDARLVTDMLATT